MTATAEDYCTCGHGTSRHLNSAQRCRGLDSYESPCECPSFEHDPEQDDEDAAEDDYADERRLLERRYGGRGSLEER